MINFESREELQTFISREKDKGLSIGFVPTMGALHAGHLSLIQAAKDTCDLVVCSVFVNPTQFNKAEDLEKYPRNEKRDKELLEKAGCHVLFLPSVQTIYPDGTDHFEVPSVGHMAQVYEGEFRPGHFDGMMQVVSLLLDIVNPSHMFMGLKDFQQFAICKKMVEIQGRTVEVCGMPTFRETNGLAMSSRNERLSAEAKKDAKIIYETLDWVKQHLLDYDNSVLAELGERQLKNFPGLILEYFDIVDKTSLKQTNNKENLIALCAARIEGVRLIDNMIL